MINVRIFCLLLLMVSVKIAYAEEDISVLDNIFTAPVQTWSSAEQGTLTLGGSTPIYGFKESDKEPDDKGVVKVKVKGIVDNDNWKKFCWIGYSDGEQSSYRCKSSTKELLNLNKIPKYDVTYDDVTDISISNNSQINKKFINENGELNLEPGDYGSVDIQTAGTTVYFKPGNFKIKKLTITNNAKIHFSQDGSYVIDELVAQPWGGKRIGIESNADVLTVKKFSIKDASVIINRGVNRFENLTVTNNSVLDVHDATFFVKSLSASNGSETNFYNGSKSNFKVHTYEISGSANKAYFASGVYYIKNYNNGSSQNESLYGDNVTVVSNNIFLSGSSKNNKGGKANFYTLDDSNIGEEADFSIVAGANICANVFSRRKVTVTGSGTFIGSVTANQTILHGSSSIHYYPGGACSKEEVPSGGSEPSEVPEETTCNVAGLLIDTAYVGGNAPVYFSSNCQESSATVDVEFSFDSSASGFTGPVIIGWDGGSQTLNAGQKSVLTLPVSGATLSYPRADLLTLSARQMLPEGGYAGDAVDDQVAFVPKAWKVQNSAICSDVNGFDYMRDVTTCPVLASVGNDVNVGILALDINDQPLPLNWLKNKVSNNNPLFQAVIEHPHTSIKGKVITLSSINDNGERASISEHTLKSDIVGAVKVSLGEWVSTYIPTGDTSLTTLGDEKYIGRTVPASLRVMGTTGSIDGNLVYAEQLKPIKFQTMPHFIVEGLDTSGDKLPSYSGEFAVGLMVNSKLTLETPSGINLANPELNTSKSEPITGQHLISFNHEDLMFIKNNPFSETLLTFPLELAIDKHELNNGASGKTNLASADDKLRYGFLNMDELELPVNAAGVMSVHLNYYGSNVDSIQQDISSITGVETSSSIFSLTPDLGVATAKPTGLEFNEQIIEGKLVKVIKVPAHSSEWRGNVEMEVDKWLKPYRDGLVNPSAELNITNDARKRGNDRVFNRREVVR